MLYRAREFGREGNEPSIARPTIQIPRDESYSLQALVRSEIYFPFPSQFNDPFDCSFAPNFHEVEDSEIPVILDWLAQRSGTPVEQLRAQLAMEGKEEFL